MRSVAVAWLVALALGALPHLGRAADVTMQVSAGLGGVVKEGAWVPVFADITNDGESEVGELVVPIRLSSRTDRWVQYVTEVELPRHSKKRYALCLPSTDFEQVILNLAHSRTSSGVPRFQTLDRGDLAVIGIGGDPGFLSFLNGTEGLGLSFPNGGRWDPSMGPPPSPEMVSAGSGRLDWAGLPDSWLAWQGADVVVLGDANTSGASAAALEALRAWVECGGTLVVPGGALASAMGSGPFAPFLPGTVTGTTTVPDLAALGTWAGRPIEARPSLSAQLSLRPHAEVILGTRAQPLIASQRVGAGRVIMTSFDFTAAPLKYWDGQQLFWTKLLSSRAPEGRLARQAESNAGYNPYNPQQSVDLVNAVSTMPQAELPSMWLIVGFLIAYIVVLVPVNYSVLNRLGRRELAWVTTPGIVLLFTFGAYGLGYSMRGGAILLNRIGIVEAGAGAPVGRGTSYLGLFSPGRTRYEVAIDAPSAGSRDLSPNDGHVRAGTRVFSTPKARIADVYMNMWTTRSFGMDYCADLKGGVLGSMEYDGAALNATVTNRTGYTLKDCRITRAASEGRAKDLRPGEKVELTFLPSQAVPIATVQPFQPGGGAKPELREMARSALFTGPTSLPQSSPALPMLVAQVSESLSPAHLAGEHPQLNDVSLLIVHLPIRLARHRTTVVPDWLVSSRVIASSGSFSSGSGQPMEFLLEQGALTVEYTLPTGGAPAVAKRLALVPAAGRALPLAGISVYDFTHEAWLELQSPPSAPSGGAPGGGGGWRGGGGRGGGGGMRGGAPASPSPGTGAPGGGPPSRLVVPRPEDAMSPDGKVLVRVNAPAGGVSTAIGPLLLRPTVEVQ